ncbi:hypothetical protein ACIQWR_38470 [Streptomyces sp. NPDC098789]|uniref:hypothetical protein n=1 Tax=Streptomyces sp. NPDC098789 TaxID=3366098 RepID=UPI00381F94A8
MAELGVPCAVPSLGSWASGTYALGEELLVMDRDLLHRLPDGTWSPYELTLIDVPADVAPAQLDALALVLGTTGTTARFPAPCAPAPAPTPLAQPCASSATGCHFSHTARRCS